MNEEAKAAGNVDSTAAQLEMNCRSIADELEAIVDGCAVRNASGDIMATAAIDDFLKNLEGEEKEKFIEWCEENGHIADPAEMNCEDVVAAMVELFDAEEMTTGDYLDDVLDIVYICDAKKEYRSVRVTVAVGGPNIYVDTDEGAVQGYWGGSRAEWHFGRDVRDAIDGHFEDLFNCLP